MPPRPGKEQSPAGLFFALGAFSWWGLAPVYFKAVAEVEPLEVLAHRVLWSALLLMAALALRQGLSGLFAGLMSARLLACFCATALK